MSVSENQLYDTVIGTITAVDADGPFFNRIFYSIELVNSETLLLIAKIIYYLFQFICNRIFLLSKTLDQLITPNMI